MIHLNLLKKIIVTSSFFTLVWLMPFGVMSQSLPEVLFSATLSAPYTFDTKFQQLLEQKLVDPKFSPDVSVDFVFDALTQKRELEEEHLWVEKVTYQEYQGQQLLWEVVDQKYGGKLQVIKINTEKKGNSHLRRAYLQFPEFLKSLGVIILEDYWVIPDIESLNKRLINQYGDDAIFLQGDDGETTADAFEYVRVYSEGGYIINANPETQWFYHDREAHLIGMLFSPLFKEVFEVERKTAQTLFEMHTKAKNLKIEKEDGKMRLEDAIEKSIRRLAQAIDFPTFLLMSSFINADNSLVQIKPGKLLIAGVERHRIAKILSSLERQDQEYTEEEWGILRNYRKSKEEEWGEAYAKTNKKFEEFQKRMLKIKNRYSQRDSFQGDISLKFIKKELGESHELSERHPWVKARRFQEVNGYQLMWEVQDLVYGGTLQVIQVLENDANKKFLEDFTQKYPDFLKSYGIISSGPFFVFPDITSLNARIRAIHGEDSFLFEVEGTEGVFTETHFLKSFSEKRLLMNDVPTELYFYHDRFERLVGQLLMLHTSVFDSLTETAGLLADLNEGVEKPEEIMDLGMVAFHKELEFFTKLIVSDLDDFTNLTISYQLVGRFFREEFASIYTRLLSFREYELSNIIQIFRSRVFNASSTSLEVQSIWEAHFQALVIQVEQNHNYQNDLDRLRSLSQVLLTERSAVGIGSLGKENERVIRSA